MREHSQEGLEPDGLVHRQYPGSKSPSTQVIKCLLIVPFPESALNEEAGKMFMEDYDEYFKYARLITELHAKPKELKAQ